MPLISVVMNAKRWIQPPVAFLGIQPIRSDSCGEDARAAMIRATQESAVLTARAHWDILRELSGANPCCVTFCGGSFRTSSGILG